MPSCQTCQRTWSWSQTFKRTLSFRIGMLCPYCHEKQYYSARYRNRSTIISAILGPFIIITGYYFGISVLFLFIALVLLVAFFVANPFFVELSNEEEPLF